jgi:hypothetical protein
MNLPPATWAAEMQALQDQIERLGLELEVCRHDESNVQYWAGQDDGVRGVCLRWEEALSTPIPKAGVMQAPLESLYRRTETLRLERDTAVSDLALARGMNDGYVCLLQAAMAVIEQHWAPHDPESSDLRDALLERFGQSANAAWEAVAARLQR